MDLILGGTGFVGSNLRPHFPLAAVADRKSISCFYGQSFEKVFCCAPQAKKWWANLNPQQDLREVEQLIRDCSYISVKAEFILFGTIDIFDPPIGVNELSEESFSEQPYGMHRYLLENRLREIYGEKLRIIRLPALVGKDLRKNIIYDLLHQNNLHMIPINSHFQWFNLEFLPDVLSFLTMKEFPVLNVATQPVSTRLIVDRWFPNLRFQLDTYSAGSYYNVHTLYGAGSLPYLYDKREILDAHLAPYIEENLPGRSS